MGAGTTPSAFPGARTGAPSGLECPRREPRAAADAPCIAQVAAPSMKRRAGASAGPPVGSLIGLADGYGLPDRDRPQSEPATVPRILLVVRSKQNSYDLVARQLLQVVELADVHALLDQQVVVHRDEAAADRLESPRWRDVLQAAGVGADQDGALLLDQPLGRLDRCRPSRARRSSRGRRRSRPSSAACRCGSARRVAGP